MKNKGRKKKMIVKRFAMIGFTFILLAVYPFSAYGKDEQKPLVEPKKIIKMGIAPAQWVTSRLADNLLAEVITKGTSYDVKGIGGLGSVSIERFGGLMEGTIDITRDIAGYTMALMSYKKIAPKQSERFQYLAFMPCTIQPIPLIVYKELPINSLKDAIDKRYPLKIGINRGSQVELIGIIWQSVGSPNGVNDIIKWGGRIETKTTPSGYGPLLREGIVNAYMMAAPRYYAFFEEVNSVKPLKVLPVAQDNKHLQLIQKQIPEILRWVMPKGNYSFVNEETPVIALLKMHIASPKLNHEVVYTLCKEIWKQRKFLSEGNTEFKGILEPEIIKFAKDAGIPFHPGALRFFNEAGIL